MAGCVRRFRRELPEITKFGFATGVQCPGRGLWQALEAVLVDLQGLDLGFQRGGRNPGLGGRTDGSGDATATLRQGSLDDVSLLMGRHADQLTLARVRRMV